MKKGLVITSLLLLSLALAAPGWAGEAGARRWQRRTFDLEKTSPFSLVSRGYQGYFEVHGIPSSAKFELAVKIGDIEARDLVEAGVRSGILAPERLNDSDYLYAVQTHLDGLDRD